jgi:uncharacterized protein YhaN
MKIDAIRLAQFRRFTSPIAVEDLSPGINVLAGPNEMGKSTVFRALEAVFLTRHKVTGAGLDELRPLSGGEPLVEADFTVGATRWRIRKQFGRGNTAVLSDAMTGRIVARNAEAEEELARLIGRKGNLTGPLGLVWVRQQRALSRPDPDFDHDTGKQKSRGELSALQAAVRGEIEAAAAGEELQRIQALTAKALDVLLTNARNAPKKNGPLDRARCAAEDTRSALQRASRAAEASEQRMQEIDRTAIELARMTEPQRVAQLKDASERLEARIAAERRRRNERDVLRQALRTRELERSTAVQALSAASESIGRIETLKEQAAIAHALQADIARLADELNADPATRPSLDRIMRIAHARDLARAESQADPAVVEISPEPDAVGRITLAGKPVTCDTRTEIAEAVEIRIEGIGTIRVHPPGAARVAAARARAEEATVEIETALADLGVSAIDEARDRVDARAKKAEELDRIRARLSGLAPKGPASLDAEIAERVDGATSSDIPSLQEVLKSAEAAEHVVRAEFDALCRDLLSDQSFSDLSDEAAKARIAIDDAERRAQQLASRIENLKSEQVGADEDGLAGEVGRLRGTLERQESEVKRLEGEGKALLLLSRTLQEIESEAREKVFAPLNRRLKPYLDQVFGAADLGFKDAFAVAGLTRDGEMHEFAKLSDGTQEQLNVLVRLAYAELLGEQGEAVPLVLDDPLVYSDDARLESLCRVLAAAAGELQIVLLTCRPHAFQNLSGRRVSLTAWQPE